MKLSPERFLTEWEPLTLADLQGWAQAVLGRVTASKPHLAESERRGILSGGSGQALVVCLRSVRGVKDSWRVWSDLVTTTIFGVETQAPGAGAVALETLLGTVLSARSLEDLRDPAPMGVIPKRLLQRHEFDTWVREFAARDLGLGTDVTPHPLVESTLEALRKSGPKTRILVEVQPGASRWQVVSDRGTGWKFRHGILPQGISEPWVRTECRVCLVDGIIDTVASIDPVLQEANRTKTPVLLLTRGMTEEVLATLVTNLRRGRLDIMPVTLDPGVLSAVNVLADLATCTQAHVTSPWTGDLLTSITLEGLATVPRVRVVPVGPGGESGEVWVENPRAAQAVRAHLQNLQDRLLHEVTVPDIATIFETRLRSLASDTVRVLLPGGTLTPREVGVLQSHLDTLLRTIKSVLGWGVVADVDPGLLFSRVIPPTDPGMPIAAPIRLRSAPCPGRTCLASFLGENASRSLLDALARVSGSVTENRRGT